MDLTKKDLLMIIIDKLGIDDPEGYFKNMPIEKQNYCTHSYSHSSLIRWGKVTYRKCDDCEKWVKNEKI